MQVSLIFLILGILLAAMMIVGWRMRMYWGSTAPPVQSVAPPPEPVGSPPQTRVSENVATAAPVPQTDSPTTYGTVYSASSEVSAVPGMVAKPEPIAQSETMAPPIAAGSPSKTKFCRECGKPIPRSSKFCSECGKAQG